MCFFTERVEYRDENNNFIKRTLLYRRYYFIPSVYIIRFFRIFERLDNSYLFALRL